MPFYDAIRVGASGAGDFEVKRSLRFNGEGTHHYLQRTPSSAGNRQICTFSCWTKRSNIGVNHCLASAYSANNDSDNISLTFRSLSSGNCSFRVVGYNYNFRITNRLFRDISAWFHVVVAFDTTQSSADDRIKVYINGVQETSFSTSGNVTQNMNIAFNDTSVHRIGTQSNQLSNTADGYIAEVNFIDGQQLTPASFAETDEDTGLWVPKDTSGLTFGTNGYRLQFADNSDTTATTLGKDTSGNGNNFTPNNFATHDSVIDTPSNNFATLNPLSENGGTYSEGNLKLSAPSGFNGADPASSTIGFASGKFYYETYVDATANMYVGVIALDVGLNPARAGGWGTHGAIAYRADGQQYSLKIGSSSSITSYGATYTAGDIIGCAVDIDNDTVTFYKNGASQGNTTYGVSYLSPTGAKDHIYGIIVYANGGNNTFLLNFGQDGTFQGTVSAGGNADASGIGNFKYTVPAGFKALCSANFPDPIILFPTKHFNTLLYTGNGSTQSITGLSFQPDWVWIKKRSSGGSMNHTLFDSVRGATKYLQSNVTSAETTLSSSLTSFDSNGFSLGNYNLGNLNNASLVAWNWNAGDTDSATYTVKVVSDSGNKYRFNDFGTSAVTLDLAEGGTYTFDQSDSSMSSHPMQLSTTANGTHGGGSAYSTGVTYELDGSTVTASAFISGFSSASSRKLIITVAASAPTLYYYCYYHSGMGGAVNTNSTLGSSNFDGTLQSTVKANLTAGFSIVSYTGNETAGATFGHGLGIIPRVVLVKRRVASEDWIFGVGPILGSGEEGHYFKLNDRAARATGNGPFNSTNPSSSVVTLGTDQAVNDNGEPYICYCFNEVSGYSKLSSYVGNGNSDGIFVYTGFRVGWLLIKANLSESWYIYDNKRNPFNVVDKEIRTDHNYAEGTFITADFLSNGFKIRATDSAYNQNGATYTYYAFAESPFKNSRAR